MKYLQKEPFQVGGYSKNYFNNWEDTFKMKEKVSFIGNVVKFNPDYFIFSEENKNNKIKCYYNIKDYDNLLINFSLQKIFLITVEKYKDAYKIV